MAVPWKIARDRAGDRAGLGATPSTQGLTPQVKRALRVLLGTLRGLGYVATYTSGYRSPTKQRQLYAAWQAGKSKYPVAPPGRSTHNYGLAVDVWTDAPDEIKRFAADVAGLVWFGPGDRVHYDVYGPTAWRAVVSEHQRSGD